MSVTRMHASSLLVGDVGWWISWAKCCATDVYWKRKKNVADPLYGTFLAVNNRLQTPLRSPETHVTPCSGISGSIARIFLPFSMLRSPTTNSRLQDVLCCGPHTPRSSVSWLYFRSAAFPPVHPRRCASPPGVSSATLF